MDLIFIVLEDAVELHRIQTLKEISPEQQPVHPLFLIDINSAMAKSDEFMHEDKQSKNCVDHIIRVINYDNGKPVHLLNSKDS